MKKLKYIIIAFVILLPGGTLIPYIAPLIDYSSFTGNYRIPYSLGEDYFLYKQYSKYVASGKSIPVIGDSVIWGHYTGNDSAISAQLNRLNPGTEFKNMGLDGIHPAAMNGLLNIYSARLTGRKVIVGINLLWMSSPRHDLSGPVNSEINHKSLLPQLNPKIPSYRPSSDEKLSALVTRSFAFFSWIDHVRLTCFARKSFYLWTLDNPRKNIAGFFSREDDVFKIPDGMEPGKMQEQNIEWTTAEKSLQWRFMIDTLGTLKNNGNRVAALVTPFNTYMMTDESRKKYFAILAEMERILRANGIIPVIPTPLEKKYFADASHPTADGYRLIAEDIMKNREFLEFIKN